jgi:hypothetical protein
MKLKLKNTPEQVELIKAMGSRDANVAREATQAFAAFIGPVVSKVLMQAGTASAVYSDLAYDEDDNPSIPLDLWVGEGEGYTTVWSQNVAGGLPTSNVEGFSELKVATYRLDSAVSMLKRYVRRGRLDVVSKAVERMTNEVLVKQERNAWAVVLRALAEARSNGASHIERITGGALTLGGLNNLITLVKRINTSYAAGTTDSSYGLTDLFVSPEIKADIRAFAYNPVGQAATTTDLPANVREEIYRNAGVQEIYGIAIHELVEFGVGKKYNTLFNSFYSGTEGGNPLNFNEASGADGDEILVGLDLTKDAFVRPVARNSETGGTFTALPDDQFVTRADKVGFYGSLEEGRVCLDGRAVAGLIVAND